MLFSKSHRRLSVASEASLGSRGSNSSHGMGMEMGRAGSIKSNMPHFARVALSPAVEGPSPKRAGRDPAMHRNAPPDLRTVAPPKVTAMQSSALKA